MNTHVVVVVIVIDTQAYYYDVSNNMLGRTAMQSGELQSGCTEGAIVMVTPIIDT